MTPRASPSPARKTREGFFRPSIFGAKEHEASKPIGLRSQRAMSLEGGKEAGALGAEGSEEGLAKVPAKGRARGDGSHTGQCRVQTHTHKYTRPT